MFDNIDFSEDLIAEWRTRAACKGMTRLFYPHNYEPLPEFLDRQEKCIAVCRTCPVIRDCLAWAMKDPLHEGVDMVLGGLTHHDRIERGGYSVGRPRRI